jgi:hypothetical protein
VCDEGYAVALVEAVQAVYMYVWYGSQLCRRSCWLMRGQAQAGGEAQPLWSDT